MLLHARSTLHLGILALFAFRVGAQPNATEPPSLSLPGLSVINNFDTNPGKLTMHLYTPQTLPDAKTALVVALHGCGGSAKQFSNAGFNELAEKYHFYVLYPEQRPENNSNLCFNHQIQGAADLERREVASVMQMVHYMLANFSVSRKEVFVTGFSSGGQLAQILAATYPRTFAAVSAIGAGGYRCETDHSSIAYFFECIDKAPAPIATKGKRPKSWPRASIWHGKRDKNVAFSRLQDAVDQWLRVHRLRSPRRLRVSLPGNIRQVKIKNRSGQTVVESYTLNSMGHTIPVSEGCGETGEYFTREKICFAKRSVQFFGIGRRSIPKN
jgi:poly(hydroxyalkanoate) depolymerase family esterase